MAGCASSGDGAQSLRVMPPPTFRGLSVDAASVGEAIDVDVAGGVDGTDGWVRLDFDGSWLSNGLPAEPARVLVDLETDANGRYRWRQFGPYHVPFGTTGVETGSFRGRVCVQNHFWDGTFTPGNCVEDFEFHVKPSIVIVDAVASTSDFIADCASVTRTWINLVPYAVRFRAVGFEPVAFEYTFSPGLLLGGSPQRSPTSLVRSPVLQPDGSFEHVVNVVYNGPGPGSQGYQASIHVKATGTDGTVRTLDFPFVVRRRSTLVFETPYELAELFEAEPVSGSQPGGPGSLAAEYSEATTETRTNKVSFSNMSGWQENLSTTHTEARGREDRFGANEGGSSTATESLSTQDGWQDSTGSTFGSSESKRSGYVISDNFTTGGSMSMTDTVLGENRVTNENELRRIRNEGITDFTQIAQMGGNLNVGFGGANASKTDPADNVSYSGSAQRMAEWEAYFASILSDSFSVESNRGSSFTTGTNGGTTESENEARTKQFQDHWSQTHADSTANTTNFGSSWSSAHSYNQSYAESESVTDILSRTTSEGVETSSATTTGTKTSALIFAEHFGMWYRQTSRMVRRGKEYTFDLCGNAVVSAEFFAERYLWGADLAISKENPPPTNHQPARCFIPPCVASR